MSSLSRAVQALSHRAVDLGVMPGGRDYVQFVLLGWYRTGSNYLRTLLDSHPEVVAYSELFSPHRVFWGTARARPLHAERVAALRDADPLGFLSDGPFREQPPGIRAVGFKLFYPQVLLKPVPGLAERLAADGVRVVHLVRENLLRLRVSALVAQRTGAMSSTDVGEAESALVATGPIVVDPQDLLAFFAQYGRRAAAAAALFAPERIHRIVYEELSAEPDRVVAEVQQFLGVTPRPAGSPLVKQARRPLKEVVLNWVDVEHALGGTEWARFLQTA